MKMKKMNKKAISFAVGMVLLAIAITVFAFYMVFFVSNERIKDIVTPLDLINIQNDAREDVFFIKESANYASQRAVYSVLNEIPMKSSSPYKKYQDIDIWNDCEPDIKKVEEKFLDEFSQEFYSLIKSSDKDIIKNLDGKYVFSLNNNILKLQSGQELEYHTLLEIHAVYKTSVSFEKELPFSLNILSDIHTRSKNAVNTCKDDFDCITEKMNSDDLDDFDFEFTKNGDYIIFTARTKDRFFFNDGTLKYDKISFDYAISLT
ncbi:MAG: hypothetical protein KJ767_03615 [Nanoarchaeota archaeon]|nr:hypothetical protein [Nanoarchaeota archaeon]